MRKNHALLALAMTGALIGGCKDDTKSTNSSSSTPPAAPAAPPVVTTPTPATPPVLTTTPSLPPTTGPLPFPASEPAATAPATPSIPATQPSSAVPDTSSTTAATTTSTTGDSDAKALLAQAEQDISAKNWDAATTDLKKLSALQDQVSPDVKESIKKEQVKLLTAKAANLLPGGVSLPPSTTTEPNK